MSIRTDLHEFDKVEKALKKAGGPVTAADIAGATGMPINFAEIALKDAMALFESKISVREDGSLVYDFGSSLVSRAKKPWTYWLKKGTDFVWKGFKFGFKIVTAVTMLSYVVVFSVLIIAAVIAMSAASEDDAGIGPAFGLIGRMFIEIFAQLAWHGALFERTTDHHGYPHRKYVPKQSRWRQKRKPKASSKENKSFIASVYDFVFGPERAPFDDKAQTREVLSFVRENLSMLTISDVQALSGYSRSEAESFFSRFIGEFNGNIAFNEDGTISATFPELMESAGREQDEPIVYYWDEYEPPFEQSGNATSRDVMIGGLNIFNLVMGGALTNYFLTTMPEMMTTPLGVFLGVFPMVFSAMFFAIPGARALQNLYRNFKQHQNNIRKRVFRSAYFHDRSSIRVRDILAAANQIRTSEETLKIDDIDDRLRKMIDDLGGDLDVDSQGEIVLRLDLMERERDLRTEDNVQEAAAIPVPEVVFETHPEEEAVELKR